MTLSVTVQLVLCIVKNNTVKLHILGSANAQFIHILLKFYTHFIKLY